MGLSELVQKLSGPLLRRLPLSKLEEADVLSFLSLDTVSEKMWSMPQVISLNTASTTLTYDPVP